MENVKKISNILVFLLGIVSILLFFYGTRKIAYITCAIANMILLVKELSSKEKKLTIETIALVVIIVSMIVLVVAP